MRLPAGLLLQPALAAALGAASVLSFAPFGWFPLVWATLAGLYALLCRVPGRRAAATVGFAFGLGWFGFGTSWVYVSLSVFGGLPASIAVVATALFCAVLALFPMLAAILFVRFRPDSLPAQAALFAALWTLTEWLRGWILTGFPWLLLGYSQAPPSPFAGFAPVIGVYGISLLVALSAALLAQAVASHRQRIMALLTVFALLATGAVLRFMPWTAPQGAPLKVALLQGNIEQDLKWRPERFTDSMRAYTSLMAAHPAQLTVLPETAVPAFLSQVPPESLLRFKEHAEAQRGDILFGIAVGDGQQYANAAVSLGLSPTQIYAKSHLVPFGEYVPPGFGWFLDMMRIPMSDFTAGPDRQPPLEIAGQRVAVNICYEDVFGAEIIRALPQATLLVNLSNTAWFGDSLAQPQHLQISQLRALEAGRPMLRATNTGMTGIVRPDGSVQAVLPPFTRDALVAEVQGYGGSTPFVWWGNRAALLLTLALLMAAAFARKNRQNQ